MAPILGIMASQISGHLYTLTGNYDSIATYSVGSGGSTPITFSSIPSTYTHLQIRAIYANAGGATNSGILQFNADTTSTYYTHYLKGNGTAASAGANANIAYIPWEAAASPNFGVMVIDILDYTNTNKYKTIRVLNGYDANGSGSVFLMSGLWRSTSAISSIVLKPDGAANWSQYSSFALYGIK